MRSTRELTLPRLGETMEEGTVVAWLKQPGDQFVRGDILAEIETDKTIVEMPALENGKLEKILAPVGTKLAVGQALASISGGDAVAPKPSQPKPAKQTKPTTKQPTKVVRTQKSGTKQIASPNARRVAREHNIDLHSVTGTGRRGRITAADLDRNNSKIVPSEIYFEHWRAKKKSRKPPWLLLHGLFGNSATWAGLATSLTELGSDVYAADLPGHGNSTAAADLDPVVIARSIAQSLRKKYPGKINIVGISLGAVIATHLASIDPKVQALYLLCPAGLGKRANKKFINAMLAASKGAKLQPALQMLGTASANLGTKAVAIMQQDLQDHAVEFNRMATAWFPQGNQQLNIAATLATLGIPVKSLFTRNDEIIPWQDCQFLPDNVASYFLAEAGHLPHLDRLDRVLAFLQH